MKRSTPCLLLLSCFLAGNGCTLVPEYKRPQLAGAGMPTEWKEVAAEPSTPTAASPEATEWWQEFQNDKLNALIQDALAANTDLDASIQRLDQARADLRIAGSGLWPSVDASGSLGQNYFKPGHGSDSFQSAYHGALSISYEADLWGRNRATRDAASMRMRSSRYEYASLALVVMSDVARTYAQWAAAHDRIGIAEKNLSNARDLLAVVEARFDAGASSALEVAQQRATIAFQENSLLQLQNQRDLLHHQLALLLGKSPQEFSLEPATLEELRLPQVAPGQPSKLLERRPDILQSESDLVAANIDIGIARAAMFPSLRLGIDPSIVASPITAAPDLAASLAASLAMPLFHGGALEGEVERTRARQAELVAQYRGVILTSFREVEDALATVDASSRQVSTLLKAVLESQRAYGLALERYEAGATDFQDLLTAQRDQLQAEDNWVQARLTQMTSAIDLFKALGGGWETAADLLPKK